MDLEFQNNFFTWLCYILLLASIEIKFLYSEGPFSLFRKEGFKMWKFA